MNIIDYIKWRGDLSFSIDGINEIDASILAVASYFPWNKINLKSNNTLFSLSNLISEYSSYIEDYIYNPSDIFTSVDYMMNILINQPRFMPIIVSHFHELVDYEVICQFAAITFTIPNNDGTPMNVISFRGTDRDYMGWREDFDVAFKETMPSQNMALEYLNKILSTIDGDCILVGHSKGGNLAMYGGCHINPVFQHRIKKIYNFDGPGFNFDLISSHPFDLNSHKVINIIPEKSIIGMLLSHVGDQYVVMSEYKYSPLFQHNIFSWNIERTHFIESIINDFSTITQNAINHWMLDMTMSEREQFITSLFQLLGAKEGNVTPTEFKDLISQLRVVLIKFNKLDDNTKKLFKRITANFREKVWNEATHNMRISITSAIKNNE